MNQIKQLLRNKILSKSGKQLSGMMMITTLTQAVAVYKSSIIAANFGAGVELDAYNFANNLATFFLTFVSTGITTVVIPAYVKKMDTKAINTFLTCVFFITGILLCITYWGRGILVDIMTSREPEFRQYVCEIMLLTMLIQLLPAILGVTTAYFQCAGRFNLPKIILFVSNMLVVIVLTYWKTFSLYQYLYVLLAGAIIQFVFDLMFALYYGFRFSFTLDLKNTVFKEITKIFLPTLFSTGIYKINTLIDSLLSSNIGAGQLTILSYSNLVVTMVNTLVVGNLTIYAYPKIVEKVAENEIISQSELWKYIINFHGIICFILVGVVSAGREFIGILFEHGEFSTTASSSLYICMCIYMFDQQNNIIRDLLYRFFFAHGDTKSTVKNGVWTSLVNIGMSIVLVKWLKIYGIVLGTFFAGTFSLISIIARYKNKYGFLIQMRSVVRQLLITEIISIGTIALILIIKGKLVIKSQIAAFLVFGILASLFYGLSMAFRLKLKKDINEK